MEIISGESSTARLKKIRLKKVLPFLLSPGQTAYIDGRFTGEGGRLIVDIPEVTNLENIKGYLLAFDFLNITYK